MFFQIGKVTVKVWKLKKNSLQQRNYQEAPYEASMNHQYKASTRSNQSSHDAGWLFTISGLHLLAHTSSEKNRSCTSISSRESDGSFWLQSPRYTHSESLGFKTREDYISPISPGHNLRPPCNRRPAGVPSLTQGKSLPHKNPNLTNCTKVTKVLHAANSKFMISYGFTFCVVFNCQEVKNFQI